MANGLGITDAQQNQANAEGQSIYEGQKSSVATERAQSDAAFNTTIGDTRTLGGSAMGNLSNAIAAGDTRMKARLGNSGLGSAQTFGYKTGDGSIVDLSGIKNAQNQLRKSQTDYTNDKVARLNSLLDSNKYATNQKLDAYAKALPGLISELAIQVANHDMSREHALATIAAIKRKASGYGYGGYGRGDSEEGVTQRDSGWSTTYWGQKIPTTIAHTLTLLRPTKNSKGEVTGYRSATNPGRII